MYHDEPGTDADAHEWRVYSMRARLRQLAADQARTSMHSAQWDAIQDEIDGLTERLRQYEQAVPDLQADEFAARRSTARAGVFAVGASVLGLLAGSGELSAWWLWPLVVVMALVAAHQLVYAAYRWFR